MEKGGGERRREERVRGARTAGADYDDNGSQGDPQPISRYFEIS
jgi:hypothetical protein